MKKYRLKKDLGGKKAGEILNICDGEKFVSWYLVSDNPTLDKISDTPKIVACLGHPEWFEEVKEEIKPREFEIHINQIGNIDRGNMTSGNKLSCGETIKVREVKEETLKENNPTAPAGLSMLKTHEGVSFWREDRWIVDASRFMETWKIRVDIREFDIKEDAIHNEITLSLRQK
jgi:hypothetical protein